MKFTSDTNYIRASDMIFLSTALGVVNVLLSPEIISSAKNIIAAFLGTAFLVVIGIAIRFGVQWIKYFLLIMVVLGLIFSYEMIINEIVSSPVNGTLTVIQSLLQYYAIILMFLKK